MAIWQWIQNELLGMQWLNRLIGSGLAALGVDGSTRLGGSLQFFLYDVIKITVLLCVLIFVISYIQSYFPPERSRRILGRWHGLTANLVAALLGFVLDLLLGDPPWMPHPVVLMGRCITALEGRLRALFPATPRGELAAGGVLALSLPLGTVTWKYKSAAEKLRRAWKEEES